MRVIALSLVSFVGILAAPIQWAGNGHYYQFVSTGSTFSQARAAALASTFMGMQGYLVTITSQAENEFVHSLTSTGVWAGGSDAAVEGEWRWLDGPEAGQLFWTGGPGGTASGYANWNGGEPNNVGDEDVLQLNRFAPALTWNDWVDGASQNYIIEYSRGNVVVPEPSSFVLAGAAVVGFALLRRKR